MADGSEEFKQAQGAEQPQDDLFMQLMGQMQSLQSTMSSIKGGHVAARSDQRFQDVKKVEADVMVECLRIKEQIFAVRTTLLENINSPTNINGCLRGCIDEYLASFDAQFASLQSKFEDDRNYWKDQVQTAVKFEQVHAVQMMEHYRKFQMSISGCLTPTPAKSFEIKGLKDLENFGNKLNPGQETFRWPTLADLEKLNLTGPLKLKEIRTKGKPTPYMSAIQLVFENGIESPLFDVEAPSANLTSTFQVASEPITSFSVTTCGLPVYKLEIEQGGIQKVVLDVYNHDRKQTRQVPANHSIVGVYGKQEGSSYIAQLGFIVMED